MKPAVTAADSDADHAATKKAWVGYSAASCVVVNGVVLPNRRQKPAPPLMLSRRATGTSTCGERMPPTALPLTSRTRTVGEVDATASSGATGGGVPVRTQPSSQWYAALRIQWCAP